MLTTKTPEPSRLQIPGWAVMLVAGLAMFAGLILPGLIRPGEEAASLPPASGGPADAAQPDLQGRLLRLYGAAAVILVVAAAGLYAGRRWLGGVAPPAGRRQLAVLGGTYIGSRVRIVLVQARGQRLLAGIDSSGMRMLVPVAWGARLPEPAAGPGDMTPIGRDA